MIFDGIPDSIDDDDDGDLILDVYDDCDFSQIGFQSIWFICFMILMVVKDADEDDDDDDDLLNGTLDNCPRGMTNWLSKHADFDQMVVWMLWKIMMMTMTASKITRIIVQESRVTPHLNSKRAALMLTEMAVQTS